MSVGLVQRAMNILLKPGTEWGVIEPETATTQSLFLQYACILALIPAIGTLLAHLVGGMLAAAMLGGFSLMGALMGGIVAAVVNYFLSLAVTFAVGLLINVLAPSFDAKSDSIEAMKVSVYASTPVWVAGALSWIPLLGILVGLAAIGYGCYQLYLGIAKLMKPPADKAVVYTVVAILIEIVLSAIAFWVIFIVGTLFAFTAVAATAASVAT